MARCHGDTACSRLVVHGGGGAGVACVRPQPCGSTDHRARGGSVTVSTCPPLAHFSCQSKGP